MKPVITYVSKACVLKEYVKQKWLTTKRKILRIISRPKKQRDGASNIKRNYELRNLIKKNNIINYIRAQRLGAGSVMYIK